MRRLHPWKPGCAVSPIRTSGRSRLHSVACHVVTDDSTTTCSPVRRAPRTLAAYCVSGLRGESGGAKEVIARELHRRSPRRTKPFVKVNCAALPAGLLPCQLSGHERRALPGRARLIQICGRYEGVDERLIAAEVDEELSIGDYVLSGGELAAAVVIDAVARLQDGALNDAESAIQDSFEDGLLDCPHYTRPVEHALGNVPDVLLSGNHAEIARWRREQSLARTLARRPDLLDRAALTPEDRRHLDALAGSFGETDASG